MRRRGRARWPAAGTAGTRRPPSGKMCEAYNQVIVGMEVGEQVGPAETANAAGFNIESNDAMRVLITRIRAAG